MVPRTTSGRGFKGAAAYYLHDKGKSSADRVAFTHTLNLSTNDPHKAINEMCWTADNADRLKAQAGTKSTGRKLEKPVYAFSLSWHEDDKPTQLQMMEAGQGALKALKMDHLQCVMVAHNDTRHPHIHLIVNRIDPDTGKAHGLNKDQLVLSKWAERYEREHGKTWCAERVKNNAAREKAAREKSQGKLKSAFVKDKTGQRCDTRPAFDRRAEAIRKARAAELHRAAAQDARQTEKELYRAGEIIPPENPQKAAQAFKEQQAQDAKQHKFEQWEIQKRNAMQDRHIAERARLGQQFAERRRKAEELVEQQYGKDRQAQEKELAALIQRQQKGNALSKFVDRLRGLEEQREAIEKNLANIAQRSREIIAAVEGQHSFQSRVLEDEQDFQKRSLDRLINQQRKSGYEIPNEQRRRAQVTGRERDAKRDRSMDLDF